MLKTKRIAFIMNGVKFKICFDMKFDDIFLEHSFHGQFNIHIAL